MKQTIRTENNLKKLLTVRVENVILIKSLESEKLYKKVIDKKISLS